MKPSPCPGTNPCRSCIRHRAHEKRYRAAALNSAAELQRWNYWDRPLIEKGLRGGEIQNNWRLPLPRITPAPAADAIPGRIWKFKHRYHPEQRLVRRPL